MYYIFSHCFFFTFETHAVGRSINYEIAERGKDLSRRWTTGQQRRDSIPTYNHRSQLKEKKISYGRAGEEFKNRIHRPRSFRRRAAEVGS